MAHPELVKTNGLLKAARAIAELIDPKPPFRTIEKYIRPDYWLLAKQLGVPRSPTSSKHET